MSLEAPKSPGTPAPEPVIPLAYRRVQIGISEWAVVESFQSLGQWHAARALLDRNGVLARMGSNPFDENSTDLLVPVTEVLWAAELIRQDSAPKIEQSLGFPMVMPPPLPRRQADKFPGTESDATGAMRVLEMEHQSNMPAAAPGYGCALAALWVLLGLVVIFVVLLLATYQV